MRKEAVHEICPARNGDGPSRKLTILPFFVRSSCGRKPFRFLWNKSRAVASNLYLLLYPRGAFRDALETNPQLYAGVFAALQEIEADKFIREGRVYGGGLYKMELKELGRLPADGVFKLMRGTGMARQKVLFERG